ncbi:MAG: SH3 domain-containing protein [Chthoniobacterales bacterium]
MSPLHSVIVAVAALAMGIPASVSPLRAGTPEQASSAAEALRSGHPLDALARYRSLLTDPAFLKSGSPELWYNRGLAEEKTGENAAASLSFRRALLLDPGFSPARRQLTAVMGMLGLSVPDDWKPRLWTVVHPDSLIIIGAAVGWIGMLLFVLLLFRGSRRKGLIALALVILIAGHGASVFGTLIDPRRIAADQAVVISKAAPTLRATPADSGTPSGTVAPGTLINVLSRNGAWWYVAAGPGQTGWIPSDTVTSLLPIASPASSEKRP